MTLTRQVTNQWMGATLNVALWGAAMERTFFHRPVLLSEVVRLLAIRPGGKYVDGTLGEGGHGAAILEASMPGGQLLGLDLDPQALQAASHRLAKWRGSFTLAHCGYGHLAEAAPDHGFANPDGILFDLGMSSFQLEGSGRGFSFLRDEPLDMRYDQGSEVTAAHIVNSYPLSELAKLLLRYGEEPRARVIARAIVNERPVNTTGQLAELVARAVGGRHRRTHPATRSFQALRIAVNRELENVESGVNQALGLLPPGGRMAVISYHSLEDRIVKQTFVREAKDCLCPPRTPQCLCGHVATVRIITKRPVTPSPEEISENHRSRGARLRVAERLPERE